MNSIGDFAESLIIGEVKDISEGKKCSPSMSTNTPQAAPAGKDIREVKVPDSFMQEVLGEEFTPSPEEDKIQVENLPLEVSPEENSLMISEHKVNELLVLLKEVKELLSEMTMGTTTGSIGVNLGAKTVGGKLKPQKGYAASRKPTLPSNFKSARDVFKQSLSRKRRRQ